MWGFSGFYLTVAILVASLYVAIGARLAFNIAKRWSRQPWPVLQEHWFAATLTFLFWPGMVPLLRVFDFVDDFVDAASGRSSRVQQVVAPSISPQADPSSGGDHTTTQRPHIAMTQRTGRYLRPPSITIHRLRRSGAVVLGVIG